MSVYYIDVDVMEVTEYEDVFAPRNIESIKSIANELAQGEWSVGNTYDDVLTDTSRHICTEGNMEIYYSFGFDRYTIIKDDD